MSEKIVVKVNSGSSGLIALIISFFFGPIGAFFSWWLIAKWSFLKSFLYAIIFLILLVISALLIYLIIGIICIPIVDIIMLVLVYKACSNQTIEIEVPVAEKSEDNS